MIRTRCRFGTIVRCRYINLPELNFTDEKSDLVQKHTLGEKAEKLRGQDEPGLCGECE